jgi:hypothetical protein
LTETADISTEFSPENFHFQLKANSDFCFFDRHNVGIIGLTLSVGKGAPLRMNDGERSLRIGARLFRKGGSAGGGGTRTQLSEFRVDSEPFTLRKGGIYEHNLVVHLPEDSDGDLVLEIDLVKELYFWLGDLGHPVLSLPITRRHVIIAPGKDDTHDMAQALVTLDERRLREARYEAIIFALLNQLSRRGSKDGPGE